MTLSSDDFNLEPNGASNCWDYIDISNSDNEVVSRQCGTSFENVAISGSSATIRMRTDGSVTRSGFNISYTSSDQGMNKIV